MVHRLIPRLAHSDKRRFSERLAVRNSYPVRSSLPQRSKASSTISFKLGLNVVRPVVVIFLASYRARLFWRCPLVVRQTVGP